jgi:hypothetical protein
MLDEMTPHEVWIGKKPPLTDIKIFSSDAYVHIPKENRSRIKRMKRMSLLAIKMI